MTKVITITTDDGWIATYGGGPYIDIHHKSNPETAIDCVNVWNYATDAPTIPLTVDAVIDKVTEWEAENADDVLKHVIGL
jgi:hypothetical protein